MPIDLNNVSASYQKNAKNLNDVLWFGYLYQQMYGANDDNGVFDEYSEEQKAAIGFVDDDNLVEADVKEIEKQITVTYMPERSRSEYKAAIIGLHKAYNRALLQNEAIYRQVLNALPENEPNRDQKAQFLFARGVKLTNDAAETFMWDQRACFTDRFFRPTEDVFRGKTHGGNAREATVGEALDMLGFSDEEKNAFAAKYGYESPGASFYAHMLKKKPSLEGNADNRVMDDAYTFFKSCVEQQFELEADADIGKEMTPEEHDRLTAWQNKQEEIRDPKLAPISQWIDEKGGRIADELFKAHTASVMQKNRLLLEGGRSLSEFSLNAPLRDVLDRQALDTAYIAPIIQETLTSKEVVADLAANGGKKLAGLERKSGKAFINDIRKAFENNEIDTSEANPDYPGKQFADIFAARILSHSVRGKLSSLETKFSRSELEELSGRLQENELFGKFIEETYGGGENGKKLRETTRKLYASRTHGGFIEDEFKKFLLRQPAGELEHKPELARFMPTAKERIEELQRQVKKAPDDRTLQAAAAAEIIAIRNACRVERKTGYGLNNRIPTGPEGEGLEEEMNKLVQDPMFSDMASDDAVREALLSGHGGKMMTDIRKNYETQVRGGFKRESTTAILQKNTVGARIAALRAEAMQINRQLADRDSTIRNAAMERSVAVLGEYTALVDRVGDKDKDTPWKAVEATKKSALEKPEARAMLKTREQVLGMMNAVAAEDVGFFKVKIAQELKAIGAADAPKAPVRQQPGKNVEQAEPVKEEAQNQGDDMGLEA